MEKELTIVLIVLLILFIIYMVIQKTEVCSIVRNEREKFNVGAPSRKNIGLSLLGIGAVAGVGGYISNKKKLKEWNEAKKHWVIYDDSWATEAMKSPHTSATYNQSIPYTLIYTDLVSRKKINPKITDESLDLANEAMKDDIIKQNLIRDNPTKYSWPANYNSIISYQEAINQIKIDCAKCPQIKEYEKRIKQINRLIKEDEDEDEDNFSNMTSDERDEQRGINEYNKTKHKQIKDKHMQSQSPLSVTELRWEEDEEDESFIQMNDKLYRNYYDIKGRWDGLWRKKPLS